MKGLLPLSLEMVGTDISRLTIGALAAGKGVVGGKQKTRVIERVEGLVFGEISCLWKVSCLRGIRCCYVSWVAHGPTLVELWPRA